jgi:hypothetical protein
MVGQQPRETAMTAKSSADLIAVTIAEMIGGTPYCTREINHDGSAYFAAKVVAPNGNTLVSPERTALAAMAELLAWVRRDFPHTIDVPYSLEGVDGLSFYSDYQEAKANEALGLIARQHEAAASADSPAHREGLLNFAEKLATEAAGAIKEASAVRHA